MSDVVALFNHDDNYVLGRSISGTMTFDLRSDGIYYDIDPSDAAWVEDMVMKPLRRGDIRGSSFQFTIPDEEGAQEWKYDKQNQVYYRTIFKVERLIDLSVVTRPAYSASSSGLSKRSIEAYEAFKELTEKEIKEELERSQGKSEAEIKEELEKQQDNDRQLEDYYLRSTERARVRLYALS